MMWFWGLLVCVCRDISDHDWHVWVGSLFPNGDFQRCFPWILKLSFCHYPDQTLSPLATNQISKKMCALGSLIFIACCKARHYAPDLASWAEPREYAQLGVCCKQDEKLWLSRGLLCIQWLHYHQRRTTTPFPTVGPKGLPKLLERPVMGVPLAAPQCQWARGWVWGKLHSPVIWKGPLHKV